MLKVVVPDPGLRENAGHHPAMIEAIANTSSHSAGEFRLSVLCHEKCSDEFISRMDGLNVCIEKHFSTDFYKYVSDSKDCFESGEYINRLALEYVEALKKDHGDSDLVYLFHTLCWQHAIALSSAISIVGKHYGLENRYVICLMFDPGVTAITGEWNISSNYNLAFRALSKHKTVKFYASDYELRGKYEEIIGKRIEIHPCMLISEGKDLERDKQVKRVILYVGDAKPEKGFMDVPYLLKKYSYEIDNLNSEFVIQYSFSTDNDELKRVEKDIKSLAEKDSRITVIDKFLSQDELDGLFINANLIVFNYDEDEYKNKSSGVLWLAARFGLEMVFLTNTWLNREAERISSDKKYRQNLYGVVSDWVRAL